MVDVFENAVSILIHDKDVCSIKTIDGTVVWEKPVQTTTILVFGGDTISFGQNLVSTGDVTVDWGDGTTEIINNPTTNISHTYSDGETTHTVILDGEITRFINQCFIGCTNLISVNVSNSVNILGAGCFRGCTALTSINIPSSVEMLGNSCFSGCTGLTSVILPNNIYSINTSCFEYCTNLTSINIPNSVTTIGSNCFTHCLNLIDYQLHWQGNSIIKYNSSTMPINSETIFTIPHGSTEDYVAKGYPSDRLVERGA